MIPLAAASAGIGILGKGITGFFQKKQANKLDRENPFVKEEVSDELLKNQADAELRANQGLAAPAYNRAQQNIDRGTSTYLRAFGKTGRAGSLLSAIRGQNDALLNLDVQDAAAIERNRGTLRQQNQIMAGEKARLFNLNIRQPYEKIQQRISNLRAAGNANIGGMFTDAAQLGGTMLGSQMFGGGKAGSTLPGIGDTPSLAGLPIGYGGTRGYPSGLVGTGGLSY